MTVREAVQVLRKAKTIVIAYGDTVIPFERNNQLFADAFGDYIVHEIQGVGDSCGYYEISVAVSPLKGGAAQ